VVELQEELERTLVHDKPHGSRPRSRRGEGREDQMAAVTRSPATQGAGTTQHPLP